MILEEDKRYVTRTLQIVHDTYKNGKYYIGKLLEKNNWLIEFNKSGICITHPSTQSIISEITASEESNGIYSDFEISLNRTKIKLTTCIIVNDIGLDYLFDIKNKRRYLDNCLNKSDFEN